MHFDERNRMHRTNGLAVEFSDGWGVASVRGTRVPNEWVTKPLDPKTALAERNMDRRMAASLIVGWDKILADLPHKVIDSDPDPEVGTLISVDLPDSLDCRFVKARCATGRQVVYMVGNQHRTALAAYAASYGVTENDIRNLEVRT